jgi:hypothetical protein
MNKKFNSFDRELIRKSNALLDNPRARAAAERDREPTAFDIALIGGRLTDVGETELKAQSRRIKRRVIINAVDADDIARVVAIADGDAELLKTRRGKGEVKRRPQAHDASVARKLDACLEEIDLLRRLWKLHQIKVVAPKETARDIVIARLRGDEELKRLLINRDKTLHRK